MIRHCEKCIRLYDDEFRSTICPHDTFAANDGKNNFAHHTDSLLSQPLTMDQFIDTVVDTLFYDLFVCSDEWIEPLALIEGPRTPGYVVIALQVYGYFAPEKGYK